MVVQLTTLICSCSVPSRGGSLASTRAPSDEGTKRNSARAPHFGNGAKFLWKSGKVEWIFAGAMDLGGRKS